MRGKRRKHRITTIANLNGLPCLSITLIKKLWVTGSILNLNYTAISSPPEIFNFVVDEQYR